MNAILEGHGFINEIQSVSQVFYPNEGFVVVDEPVKEGITVSSRFGESSFKTVLYMNAQPVRECAVPVPLRAVADDKRTRRKELSMAAARGVYEVCSAETGENPPWGMLVGVRPTKIINEMWDKEIPDDEIIRHFAEYYRASDEKARFCMETARVSRDFIKDVNEFTDLYIGIPFCVSRCLYCSFSSYLSHKYADMTGAYIEALIKELDFAERYIKDTGKKLKTVYIGGGTPTALSCAEMEKLLSALASRFDIASVAEFTVEAGRPDTINAEKLRIMKDGGVTRVSVNPQSLNDETLKRIGREHTAKDFYTAYKLTAPFFAVNTDIIMGLPKETCEDVTRTLKGLEELAPDNITVHTLCVKRASLLKEQIEEYPFTDKADVGRMLDAAHEMTSRAGYQPYYMYRQKNTIGNFENTGYTKDGAHCLYNIHITEERNTIIGTGAGAVSKHYSQKRNRIRRIYNVKTPEEYIEKIDEMTERKGRLYECDSE